MTPVGRRFLIQLHPAATVSAGGVALPDTMPGTRNRGKIVGLGVHPVSLKPWNGMAHWGGKSVLFDRSRAETTGPGSDLWVVDEDAILAIVE